MSDLSTLLYVMGELSDIQRDLARLALQVEHGTEVNAGLRGGIVVGLERIVARLRPAVALEPVPEPAVSGSGM